MHKRCLFFFGWAAEHVCSARKQTRTVACSATYRKTYPWRLATVSAFTCAGAVVRSQTEYNSLYKARTLPGWFGCRYSSSMALCPNSSCQTKRSRKIFCERCSRSGPSNRTGVVAELTGVCEVMNHLAADSSGIWLAGPEHVNMGYNCEHGSESNFSGDTILRPKRSSAPSENHRCPNAAVSCAKVLAVYGLFQPVSTGKLLSATLCRGC